MSSGQLQNQRFQQVQSRGEKLFRPINEIGEKLDGGSRVFGAQGFGNDFPEDQHKHRQRPRGNRDRFGAEMFKGDHGNQRGGRQVDDVVPDQDGRKKSLGVLPERKRQFRCPAAFLFHGLKPVFGKGKKRNFRS